VITGNGFSFFKTNLNNQKIDEGQKMQWAKDKEQKATQSSTKHYRENLRWNTTNSFKNPG